MPSPTTACNSVLLSLPLLRWRTLLLPSTAFPPPCAAGSRRADLLQRHLRSSLPAWHNHGLLLRGVTGLTTLEKYAKLVSRASPTHRHPRRRPSPTAPPLRPMDRPPPALPFRADSPRRRAELSPACAAVFTRRCARTMPAAECGGGLRREVLGGRCAGACQGKGADPSPAASRPVTLCSVLRASGRRTGESATSRFFFLTKVFVLILKKRKSTANRMLWGTHRGLTGDFLSSAGGRAVPDAAARDQQPAGPARRHQHHHPNNHAPRRRELPQRRPPVLSHSSRPLSSRPSSRRLVWPPSPLRHHGANSRRLIPETPHASRPQKSPEQAALKRWSTLSNLPGCHLFGRAEIPGGSRRAPGPGAAQGVRHAGPRPRAPGEKCNGPHTQTRLSVLWLRWTPCSCVFVWALRLRLLWVLKLRCFGVVAAAAGRIKRSGFHSIA